MNIVEFAKKRADVRRLQETLMVHEYLDPEFIVNRDMSVGYKPADGIFGPNTEAAFRNFVFNNYPGAIVIDTDDFPDDIIDFIARWQPPFMQDRTSPAAKIIQAMRERFMHFCQSPDGFNIIYLEGVNPDFTLNDNKVDEWNDLRLLIRIKKDGTPVIESCHVATTGPGLPYIMDPMNPYGAARIAFGQYKSWIMGYHKGRQRALQQSAPIVVFRDLNKDGERAGDRKFIAPATINQHTTSINFNSPNVGRHSAGCLVGKDWIEHFDFIKLLEMDYRYVSNKSYQFITTVLDGKEIF